MKCHSCMKGVHTGALYCYKCRRELFDGRKIAPLTFDKAEFYKKRRELADRMSISGVQDKISLRFNDSGILEPTANDGQYILKPVPSAEDIAFPGDVVANEHLSMQISGQIFNIPTALNGLIPFKGGELAYITRRFDYGKANGSKLDQEDFASILEHTSEVQGKNYKYESSYEECAAAIRRFVPAYMPAIESFFKRIVLNYLIANGDAHLKNFSLYREPGRTDWGLTPNYDLLFTRYHVDNEFGDMGLDLFAEGGETASYGAMGYYTLEDFELFAGQIGIKERRLVKIFDEILSYTPAVMSMINNSFLSEEAKRAYWEIYLERLRLRLCYKIESYSFDSVLLPVIERHASLLSGLE